MVLQMCHQKSSISGKVFPVQTVEALTVARHSAYSISTEYKSYGGSKITISNWVGGGREERSNPYESSQ
jgi:hypothetical protein